MLANKVEGENISYWIFTFPEIQSEFESLKSFEGRRKCKLYNNIKCTPRELICASFLVFISIITQPALKTFEKKKKDSEVSYFFKVLLKVEGLRCYLKIDNCSLIQKLSCQYS